jgi:hypothetical protein
MPRRGEREWEGEGIKEEERKRRGEGRGTKERREGYIAIFKVK